MIVTLTPNPSLDRTITVTHLIPGEVNRATGVQVDPGGKGINVSRALAANGVPTRAIVPLGGTDGALHASLLEAAGLEHVVVPITGRTRTNVAVIDADGTTTKVNEPGPELRPTEVAALRAAIPHDAATIVLCGSLPGGLTTEFFAELIDTHHGRVVVDTSGSALKAAVAAGPYLIKPNREELEELVGRPLPSLDDVRTASQDLVASGITVVVASLGSEGAMLTCSEGQWYVTAPAVIPRSTVGAGDCLLAGVLAALDRGCAPREALEQGVIWGAAAVGLPGSRVPGPKDISKLQ